MPDLYNIPGTMAGPSAGFSYRPAGGLIRSGTVVGAGPFVSSSYAPAPGVLRTSPDSITAPRYSFEYDPVKYIVTPSPYINFFSVLSDASHSYLLVQRYIVPPIDYKPLPSLITITDPIGAGSVTNTNSFATIKA